MTDFILDSRLEADTLFVGELLLSRVLLMKDARFPWLILVPRRMSPSGEVIREIIDLAPRDRAALYREIEAASAALQQLFSPKKLNIAALGNQVSQLHIHVIARFETDLAWPNPVWGSGKAEPYPVMAGEARAAALAQAMGRL